MLIIGARRVTWLRIFGLKTLLPSPPVPVTGGLLGVAGLTQRLQVTLCVGAAVLEWDDVVNLGRRSNPAVILAVDTQWVGCNEPVTDLAPRMVVTLVNLRVAPCPVVFGFRLLEISVGLAVAGVGQAWAARMFTRVRWFSWHYSHLHPRYGEAPTVPIFRAGCGGLNLLINHLQYDRPKHWFLSQVSDTFQRLGSLRLSCRTGRGRVFLGPGFSSGTRCRALRRSARTPGRRTLRGFLR